MKIKPEHYEQLKARITEYLEKTNPAMPIEFQALGLSPMRLRWDALQKAGIRVGDSVGMTRPDNIPESHFLPLYDYLNDDHIDTALRSVFAELGNEYGAAHNLKEAPALQVTEANRLTPAGNLLGVLTFHDPRTGEQASSTCVVTTNGGVYSETDIGKLAKQGNGTVTIADIEGDEHEVLVCDGELQLSDDAFIINQSVYTCSTFDLVQHGEVIEREEGRWEHEPFTLAEIKGEARNHSYSEFSNEALYSTDPSGTREYYEQGIERQRCMQIESINGQPPKPEQMQALGQALGLQPGPDFRLEQPKAKAALSMGM